MRKIEMFIRGSVLFRIYKVCKHAMVDLTKRGREVSEIIYYEILLRSGYQWFRQARLVQKLKKEPKINIIIVASMLSQWRYTGLWHRLSESDRFKLTVIVAEYESYPTAQREQERKKMKEYLSSQQIPYLDYLELPKQQRNIRKWLRPDILFYTQPYSHMLGKELDPTSFYDRLLCFADYGFSVVKSEALLNLPTLNLAWKNYVSTAERKEIIQLVADHKGRNVVYVGLSNSNDYLNREHRSPWKIQSKSKLRIIWAPHFTIDKKRSIAQSSNFLDMADLMLDIAHKYADKIQFAFKPHPKLMVELYAHQDWGKDRTDKYYREWEFMPNTQLELGEYIDLFMTSDAMIHDSTSFIAEYIFAQKPCMYTSSNMDVVHEYLSEEGLAALNSHYIGHTRREIVTFIEDVVLKKNDYKVRERKEFYDKYLLPPNLCSAPENMANDIKRQLNIK